MVSSLWVPDIRPWALTSTYAFSSAGLKVTTMVPNRVESQIRCCGCRIFGRGVDQEFRDANLNDQGMLTQLLAGSSP
jgi:hypothetical protein